MAGARHLAGRAAEQRTGRRHVKNLVADRDADAKLCAWCRRRAVNAIGQVLDREIAVRCIGALDKTAAGWIVGLVEGLCHMMMLPAFCYASDMDSQSLSHWAIVTREVAPREIGP